MIARGRHLDQVADAVIEAGCRMFWVWLFFDGVHLMIST
jgi:hypothetical protein